MKTVICLNLVIILSFFHLQAQQILYNNGKLAWNGTAAYYNNGKLAWNGTAAYHDNGRLAWNGTAAYHDNGTLAWNGTAAYYDNGRLAWNGTAAYHDNGRLAWNGTAAYYDNGRILAPNLYNQIQGVDLNNTEPNEIEISKKIKLLTKKINNRIYVVGLKIQLSEKNAIFNNKENKLTTNIIQLDKDIHFEIQNRRAKISILGQNIINQMQ